MRSGPFWRMTSRQSVCDSLTPLPSDIHLTYQPNVAIMDYRLGKARQGGSGRRGDGELWRRPPTLEQEVTRLSVKLQGKASWPMSTGNSRVWPAQGRAAWLQEEE
jgi:hypothetical protein